MYLVQTVKRVCVWWRLPCLQDEGLRLLHSKAEIIDELEATLPQWVRSRTWYPAFVHILKIHPDATYEVRTCLAAGRTRTARSLHITSKHSTASSEVLETCKGCSPQCRQAGRQHIKLCREW